MLNDLRAPTGLNSIKMNDALDILLADDNLDDVFLLQQAFRKADVKHRLKAVNDGREAVAYLKGEGQYGDRETHPFPRVLLLDLNMPKMNGFELLKWIRQSPECNRLTVHVLTASARETDVEMAHYFRANSFIVKPTRLADLVAFVKALDQWHRFTSLPQTPIPERRETGQPQPSGGPVRLTADSRPGIYE
jgi:CheY-like chemotaxis protein